MKSKTFLLLLLLPISLHAQQTRTLNLDELFRLGTEHSLRLKASRIQETIADDQEKAARSTRLPGINVGATAGYIGQPTVFKQGLSQPKHPETPDWSHNYNVEATQPIYRGGKINYNIQRASLEKQIASLNTTNDKAELKMLLLRQYMDLYNLYKQKQVLARNIEESTQRLKDIQRLKKEGVVTRNDEIRSELQLTNDKLAYQEAENSISIVSQQLNIVLGLDETLLLQPDTTLLATPVSLQSYEEYVREAYTNYPGLKIARYDTQVAQNDVKLSKADYLPSLSLRAANTLSRPLSTTMQDVFANNWNIALSLSYNIASLYQNKHKLHEAKQHVFLRENVEEQIMQDIRVNVKSAYIRHDEALKRVEALRLSVQQARENYRIVQNRYLNQLSILTDLLDASNVRLEAELRLTIAHTEIIYTYYQLLRSCGNL